MEFKKRSAVKSLVSMCVVLFNAASSTNAALFVSVPATGLACQGGQSCTISFTDDGKAPSLAAMGPSKVGLYHGQMQLVQCLPDTDVSSQNSYSFQVDPSVGPNFDQYFVAFTSVSGKDASQQPFVAWSPSIPMSGMTGSTFADKPAPADPANPAGTPAPAPPNGTPAGATGNPAGTPVVPPAGNSPVPPGATGSPAATGQPGPGTGPASAPPGNNNPAPQSPPADSPQHPGTGTPSPPAPTAGAPAGASGLPPSGSGSPTAGSLSPLSGSGSGSTPSPLGSGSASAGPSGSVSKLAAFPSAFSKYSAFSSSSGPTDSASAAAASSSTTPLSSSAGAMSVPRYAMACLLPLLIAASVL